MTKSKAQKEARQLRRKYPNKTVNVVEVSKGNWGCRFSSKGKRSRFNHKTEDTKQRRKYAKGGRIEAYTFGEATTKKGKKWPH